MVSSAYIHIPFCKQKCKYCSFTSFTNQEKILGYIFALLKDIDTNYEGEVLNTLYFGGGTPSLIEIQFLKKIINKFNLDKNCEITFEINPDDVNLKYLKDLRNIGINRLSIGGQSFDDNILKLIGRRHDANQIINAVKLAKETLFENISIDLIYGLPTQTIESLKKDLVNITQLGVNHVSTYGLKIEEESHWGKFPPENLPDEDTQADMYIEIYNFLEQNNYKRYEISNFALEGFESKHNLNYWNNEEYYGFGISAHGYVDNIRYSNFNNLENYLKDPSLHQSGHYQTEKEKLEEEIFLGFRKEIGIDTTKIKNLFNIDFESKYKKILEKYIPKYITKTPQGYKLTTEGILLSNNILSEFL